jgi:quercetin dioxygenase-like cupin family protein
MPFLNLHDLEEKQLIPGFKGHFVHSENMTFAYWDIEAGAVLPEHSHFHEQVASMIAGEFELTVNGETKVLRPGSVAIVPSDAVHSGRAITICRIIDAFYPVREDYR